MSAKSIFYHYPCNDGSAAASIHELAEQNKETKFHPIIHGRPFPFELVSGRDVIFLDVTPKEDDLIEILKTAQNVLVIDHHESALPTLQKLLKPDQYIYNTTKSCCGMVWELYFGKKEMPRLLEVIQAHDLGKHTEESKNLLYYIGTIYNKVFGKPEIGAEEARNIIRKALISDSQSDELFAAAQKAADQRKQELITMKETIQQTLICDTVTVSDETYTIAYAQLDKPQLAADAKSYMISLHPGINIYAFHRYDATNIQTVFTLRTPTDYVAIDPLEKDVPCISRSVDLAKLSNSYKAAGHGGGGHPNAAGIQIKGNINPRRLPNI